MAAHDLMSQRVTRLSITVFLEINMKRLSQILSFSVLCVFFSSANAHHSFAIYDLENKTELKGVLTKVSNRNPHIIFTVESKDEAGKTVEWNIESMNPNRWKSFEFPDPEGIAEIGQEISILGWKARNGDSEMALGTIITDDKEIEIRDRIRQGQGAGRGGMGNGRRANTNTDDADS